MTTIKTTNNNGVTHEVTIQSNDVASATITGMQAMKHAWYEVTSQGNQFGCLHIFRNNYTNELVEIYEGLRD
jgi:hypothetical protein